MKTANIAVARQDPVSSSRFNWPKAVLALCLVYGIVLGLQFSILVAKPLYISEDLLLDRSMGIFLSHFPNGLRLMGGVIAAILADSYFGKYRVIAISFCLVFILTGPLTIASTWHTFDLRVRRIIYLLAVVIDLIVGFGSVVYPAFIAEQFKMPQQEISLQSLYLFDYFYYNTCVAILEFVTLEYTNEVSCFGAPKCYQIIFISYYASYGVAAILFVSLKKAYIIRIPEQCVMKDVCKCVWTALKNRRIMRKTGIYVNKHWLDFDDCFDQKWRDDLKRLGKILTMLFPNFVYYFLYAQMNSLWIFQACRLNGRLTEQWTMKPSQVEALNPVVIVVVAPLVEFLLNPFLEKYKIIHTPLQRMGLAYVLTIIAFIMAAILQIYINKHSSPIFTNGKAQFRLFNCFDKEINIKSEWASGRVKPYDVVQALEINADGLIKTNMSMKFPNNSEWSGVMSAEEAKGINYIINKHGVIKLSQKLDSSLLVSLRPSILIICSDRCKGNFVIKYAKKYKTKKYNLASIKDQAFIVTLQSSGEATFLIGNRKIKEHFIGDGGLYSAIIYKSNKNATEYLINIHSLIEPNTISITWIFPQYITITVAEIFLYVSTNMFVYTQSPPSMRSIVRGLFTAGNSLAQLILGAASLIHIPEVIWFFSLSVLLVFATIVHILMARRYTYQEAHD